jgi:hypothetical protein
MFHLRCFSRQTLCCDLFARVPPNSLIVFDKPTKIDRSQIPKATNVKQQSAWERDIYTNSGNGAQLAKLTVRDKELANVLHVLMV